MKPVIDPLEIMIMQKKITKIVGNLVRKFEGNKRSKKDLSRFNLLFLKAFLRFAVVGDKLFAISLKAVKSLSPTTSNVNSIRNLH